MSCQEDNLMIHERFGASFTFIAYSKAKLQEKEVKDYLFLAYSRVQINTHSMVTVPRFLWKIWKSHIHFYKSYLGFGMSYEHQTCTNMNLLT